MAESYGSNRPYTPLREALRRDADFRRWWRRNPFMRPVVDDATIEHEAALARKEAAK